MTALGHAKADLGGDDTASAKVRITDDSDAQFDRSHQLFSKK